MGKKTTNQVLPSGGFQAHHYAASVIAAHPLSVPHQQRFHHMIINILIQLFAYKKRPKLNLNIKIKPCFTPCVVRTGRPPPHRRV